MGSEQSQLLEATPKDLITFKINGKQYSVSSNQDKIGPETMLVDYIRDHAGLKGTKFMCREGGCGICVVTAKNRDTHTREEIVRGVNSCLVPILACDGWEITTIESLGNHKQGLHPIQQRFMKLHGTQCGYCTPGWIMNTYSMTQSKKSITMADVEDCSDGNMCRCTGYRPIVDAMKSLAMDAPEELKRKCIDIEALPSCASKCESRCRNDSVGTDFEDIEYAAPVHMTFKYGEQWVKAHDMKTLFMAMEKFKNSGIKYKIVAGNTGAGVYKNDGLYQGFIELNSVHSLRKQEASAASLILGGAITITTAIDCLQRYMEMDGFGYFKTVIKHWKRVANVSVRNLGTLAGNLMIKHTHREFPSDIFLVLEAVGAMLTIASSPTLQKMYSMQEFLAEDMDGKIIYSIHIPKLQNAHFRSFKVTRRFQNAHAYVNAAFLMHVDMNGFMVQKKPSIVYGGISPEFMHANMTESFLESKQINESTIKGAMEALDKEVEPNMKPPDAHPVYRKSLTKALLYKVLLGILDKSANPKFVSGASDIEKRLTTARHNYEYPEDEWPLYEPVPKIESPIQCSGEAEYTNDIPPCPNEAHGALVVSTVGNARLKGVDVSEALKFPGVLGWYDYKNIPGQNNYMSGYDIDGPDAIFVQDKIRYAGEPIGVIVAETRDAAFRARALVKIEYEAVEKPVLDISSALEKAAKQGKLFHDHLDEPVTSTSERIGDAPHTLKGEYKVHAQLHIPMEPQVCICFPRDDCMDVYSATQDVYHVQRAVATGLGLACNQINVFVRRLGGGFGNKLARSAHLASICAVASYTLRLPVRIVLDMETWFGMFGKRLPHLFNYEVGFDDTGKIWNMDMKFLGDAGSNASEATTFLTILGFQNTYKAEGWKAQKGHVHTNTAPNYFCRSPGMPKSTACMETIMDRIAWYLKKDPMEVRIVNFLQKGDIEFPTQKVIAEENLLPGMMKEMAVSADIPEREKFIEKFNSMNRWKKRGLAIFPSRIPIHYVFSDYKVYVAVYGHDGTVAVCHSAVEMGQGISTKVAQVVARELRIPLGKVTVKPTDSFTGANCTFTGTGVTSENMCYAAWKACKALNERLEPIKEKVENPTWENVAAYCKKSGMDLTAYGCTTYADGLKSYDLYSMAVSEVEIDCLTGEYKIIRVDITSDIGYAISPEVDIGQIEGAYAMGLGYFLQEKVQYDEETGELLTNRTWEYKPPLAKDIPEDFRLTLMRKSPNPFGVLRSKATGEPAYTLSYGVVMALRRAITAARMDAGNTDWFEIYPPITPEEVQRLCLTSDKDFGV